MFAKIQDNPVSPPAEFQSGCFILPTEKQVSLSVKEKNALPLRKATYEIEIANGLSYVTLLQQYQNNTQQFLQTLYKFPISPSVCIHRFSATFSKRRIEGVVKQKEQAKKQYSEAVSSGKKAAYGQIDAESKDIMVMKIGNIEPKQKVTIQVSYIEELELSLNTFYKFTLPIRNNPRYFNRISKHQFVESYRKKSYIEEGYFQWDFKISLKSSRKIVAYQSSSHQLAATYTNDTSTEISLSFQKGFTFDRDFVFLYSTEEFQLPSYTLGRTDIGSTVMVSFIPKFCNLDLEDAKKQALQSNNFETDIDSAKGQYIFLLDRSGSMGGSRIKKAKEALILFLKSLPIDSYFNVVSFGSDYKLLTSQSQKNGTQSIANAIARIQQMDADMGGTQIEPPLRGLFKYPVIQGYPKLIYLLTDGQVSNTQAVIDLVRRNVRYSRVHAIGIGDGASQALIKGCAEKGKGYHTFIYDYENPAEKIIQLLTDSLSAVITKVQLGYDKDLVQSIIPKPDKMPYILKGEVANFYLTFKGQLEKSTKISLAYTDSQNNLPFKSEVQINPDSCSYSFVDIMGHYKQIKALEDEDESTSWLYSVKQIKNKNRIIEMSLKYQILSQYTSFLCVEKQLVDGKYQEVKSKGQISVQIRNKAQANQGQEEFEKPLMDVWSLRGGNNAYSRLNTHAVSHQLSSMNYSVPPPPSLNMRLSPQPMMGPPLLPMPSKGHPPPPPIGIPFGCPAPSQPTLSGLNAFGDISNSQKQTLNNVGLQNSFSSPPPLHPQFLPPPPPPLLFDSLPPPPPPPPPTSLSLPPPSLGIPLEKRDSQTQDWMKNFLVSTKLRAVGPSRVRTPLPQFEISPTQSLQLPSISSSKPSLQKINQQEQMKPTAENQSLIDFDQLQCEQIVDYSIPQMDYRLQKQKINQNHIFDILSQESKAFSEPALNLEVKESQSAFLGQKKQYTIGEIVKQQHFEGHWSNLDIVYSLYGNKLAQSIKQQQDLVAIITFLVWKWIEKHHGEKEYQLIAKKAASWLKKQPNSTQYILQFKEYLL